MKNEHRFTEVYNELFPVVSAVIFAKINNRDEADDMTQEVFLLLWNRFETIENYRSWAYAVVRNKIGDYYRKKKLKPAEIEMIVNDVEFTYTNGFRDARIIIQSIVEDESIFKDNIEKVSLDLIAFRGLSFQDAADIAGIPYHRLRNGYFRIQKKIMAELSRRGVKTLEDLL